LPLLKQLVADAGLLEQHQQQVKLVLSIGHRCGLHIPVVDHLCLSTIDLYLFVAASSRIA
jgi:hypothetical protein